MITGHGGQFNLFPAHGGLGDAVLYYNLALPAGAFFPPQYTLMPNARGTLSLAFDGDAVTAEAWGASVAPVLLGSEPNRLRALLLIHLSPWGLYQLTRQSQEELAGRRLPLEEVDRGLCQSLSRAFVRAETPEGLVRACEEVLYRRLEDRAVSEALLLAASEIADRRGQAAVSEIARLTGYSERHLGRLFRAQIGMSVKTYGRLVRFDHVLKRLQKPSSGPFAALSQGAGYFDQAHFDKDFKAISGVSPRQYQKTMSGFYYDGWEICRTISSGGD